MRHVVLIRSAYGPGWSLGANQRRLDLTRGVTMRSLRSQTSQAFQVVVLLHRDDPLLEARKVVFRGARFLFMDATGTPSHVASVGYRVDWGIGSREEIVAMTRLDDDDGFAPWAMERVESVAERIQRRTALLYPFGVRVYRGRYTIVRHESNAMHTLVTLPGDTATVYEYGHRKVRRHATVRRISNLPAWVWSRHQDTISGWHSAERPLTDHIRAMFDIDWSLFGEPVKQPRQAFVGRIFR